MTKLRTQTKHSHMPIASDRMDFPIIVMGVSGAGKTTVGQLLADAMGSTFIDADDLHPSENREKMRQGIALSDSDRYKWLQAVGLAMRQELAEGCVPVVACSALKRSYRNLLREGVPSIVFLYLAGDKELVRKRIGLRLHEFMSVELLDSQYDTLEPPGSDEFHLIADLRLPPEVIVESAVGRLRNSSA